MITLVRDAGRLLRTVRYLKRQQVLGRIAFRVRRPRVDASPPPPLRPRASAATVRPAARGPSFVPPSRFHFLGVSRDLAHTGWDAPEVPLLWRYNLHYFDDLLAQGAELRGDAHAALIARWIAENPAGVGTAWAPYPTSLRIVNWIKWARCMGTPTSSMLHSLAMQARWLSARLEWHLLGNHLFANAKALVFAGLYFSGPEAEAWLQAGTGILQRELGEQVLGDGGQFERSPMYHALALEDVLDLLWLIGDATEAPLAVSRLAAELRARAGPMLHWLRCMSHADGVPSRFNDAAPGIAPPNAELERMANALGVLAAMPTDDGMVHLADSGYVRVARHGAVALLDVAPVGPDYLPGHAHADTLSFELYLHGQPLVVNRGTSEYGTGARRALERGTAAHSTVQLGQLDSSEVWAGFRVGRRAYPRDVRVEHDHVSAAHDGYRHVAGAPLHVRDWRFEARCLTVEDSIAPPSALASRDATARYHLAPGVRIESAGERRWRLSGAGALHVEVEVRCGHASVEAWLHAAAFGVLQPASTLAVRLEDGRAIVCWRWSD